MEKLVEYVSYILGRDPHLREVPMDKLKSLPLVYKSTYNFYTINLYEHQLVLMIMPKDEAFNAGELRKKVIIIEKVLDKKIIVVLDDLPMVSRKRLMDQRISFIVPGKQFFITHLLMDLREFNDAKKNEDTNKLLPSAQIILLYHILYKEDGLEQYSLKELASKFGYTQMGITKAVNNLKRFAIAKVVGSKEKRIYIEKDIPKLWNYVYRFLINPVYKTVYVDNKPMETYESNISALSRYTNMNAGSTEYLAINKNNFFDLEKIGFFKNLNEYEGVYTLEVWKYDPKILAKKEGNNFIVDPLSLYLSMKDNFNDERTEMALDNIIDTYIDG